MKYTVQQMCEAIEGSGGVVSVVAKRLGCSPSTVYRYRDRYPSVRKALDDIAHAAFTQRITPEKRQAILAALEAEGRDAARAKLEEALWPKSQA